MFVSWFLKTALIGLHNDKGTIAVVPDCSEVYWSSHLTNSDGRYACVGRRYQTSIKPWWKCAGQCWITTEHTMKKTPQPTHYFRRLYSTDNYYCACSHTSSSVLWFVTCSVGWSLLVILADSSFFALLNLTLRLPATVLTCYVPSTTRYCNYGIPLSCFHMFKLGD